MFRSRFNSFYHLDKNIVRNYGEGTSCEVSYFNYLHGVTVQIDGIIDLGPQWNNEHKLRTYTENDNESVTKDKSVTTILETFRLRDGNFQKGVNAYETSTMKSQVDDKMVFGRNNLMVSADNVTSTKKLKTNTDGKRVTQFVLSVKYNEMYDKPHKVKDDNKLNEFTKHIYKQTLKVFNEIKNKVNNHYVKIKVDFLSKNYESKFEEFVKQTQDQNIKTKLGTQKVIMNTIDTSNRILSRLVNYLIGYMDRKGILRNNMVAANVLLKEVEKEILLEYTHACIKFQTCRTENTFTNFLTETIIILLKNDDGKLKQATDAFTEVLKTTDFSNVMDVTTEDLFRNKIVYFEKFDVEWSRPVFMILKNIIAYKNQPIVVMGVLDERINKTNALLNVVDILERSLPGNEANMLEWDDTKNSLSAWNQGQRNDIIEIAQTFVNHLKKALDKLDKNSSQDLNNSLNIMIS